MISRLIAALAYAGAAFLFGVALGERGELGAVQYVFAAVIPVATIVLAWLSRDARLDVALTGLAMLGGLFLGQRAFQGAFESCLTEGQSVRAALVQYREKTEDYPSRLDDLEIDLPCDCILRDTILHYLSNDRAFRLWITNDKSTVTFTADEKTRRR